jgi:hypothetical protein
LGSGVRHPRARQDRLFDHSFDGGGERLCDRVAIIEHGRIIDINRPERLAGASAATDLCPCRYSRESGTVTHCLVIQRDILDEATSLASRVPQRSLSECLLFPNLEQCTIAVPASFVRYECSAIWTQRRSATSRR